MKTISFVTQKGGSGKTTLATQIAVAATEAGQRVAVLDIDPQGSAARWGELRPTDDIAVQALSSAEIARLPGMLGTVKERYDVVIIDTAGLDSPAVRSAMGVSDLCILPIRPSRLDFEAARPTIRALIGGEHEFCFVLNQGQVQPGNARAHDMADNLRGIGNVASPVIMARVAFQDAFGAGKGAVETDPTGRAAAEIRELWSWIEARMQSPTKQKVF